MSTYTKMSRGGGGGVCPGGILSVSPEGTLFSFSPRNWIMDEISTFEYNGILSHLFITKCITNAY